MEAQKVNQTYHSSSYRFKGWSRKSYAVFNSLHLIVNIGVLSFDICERLTIKSVKHCTIATSNHQPEALISTAGNETEMEVNALTFEFLFSLAYLLVFISAINDDPGNSHYKLLTHTADKLTQLHSFLFPPIFLPYLLLFTQHLANIRAFNNLFNINSYSQTFINLKFHGNDE